MDLRSIANQGSNTVNPNLQITIARSTGFTTGSGAKQSPTYAAPISLFGQLQALDGSELKHVQKLNIQGVLKTLYITGPLAAVIRPNQQGGDIVTIAAQPGVPASSVGTWLTTKVSETWPNWTRVVIVLQGPS